MVRWVVRDGYNATIGMLEICIGLSILHIGAVFAAKDKGLMVPVFYAMYPTAITTLSMGINNVRKSFRRKESIPDVSEFYSLSDYNPYADISYIGNRNPYRLVG